MGAGPKRRRVRFPGRGRQRRFPGHLVLSGHRRLHGRRTRAPDLSVDDQAETLKLLKAGDVLGCVADRPESVQGCRVNTSETWTIGCMPLRHTK